MRHLILAALCLTAGAALSQEPGSVTVTLPEGENVEIAAPADVSHEDGLAAWSRIHEVASHPRCANCHVGASDRPMWSGPSYGRTRPHGMNVRAGDGRMGVPGLSCQTCHTTLAEEREDANATAHAAPRVAMLWRLAPVEADWFGRSSAEICAQLSDPERNGGRDYAELAAHLDHDLILHWAWNPGGGREPAPYSLQAHVDDILAWGVAGYPCPESPEEARP